MSDQPKTYRIYCYDAARVTVFTDQVEASSDEEAIAKVEAMDFGSKCEVWDGDRLVASLESQRQTG